MHTGVVTGVGAEIDSDEQRKPLLVIKQEKIIYILHSSILFRATTKCSRISSARNAAMRGGGRECVSFNFLSALEEVIGPQSSRWVWAPVAMTSTLSS